MEAVALTIRPRSFTSGLRTLTYHLMWSCPLLAFAFGYINFCLYLFGLYLNWGTIWLTVGLPVGLTAASILINSFIELTHMQRRKRS